ncbi:MAG TPA: lysophospholipid acyltransferase family protein [Anaerolineales bacterium]|nr:lysophospholipid acyltransferase family protein [Anaerolineales bacterium]
MANDELAPSPDRSQAVRQPRKTAWRQYDHARREPIRRVLRWAITHIGWRVFARIDYARISGVENLPPTGPAILMINHIAFVDPVVVLGNLPRNIIPLAKIEVYRIPGWGVFPWLWDVIPVHREELDRRALERALAVLAAGEVILIAPEAHRHPALAQAREGIAYIGYKSGAPIIPVALENTPGYPTLMGPWNRRKPGAYFTLGRPFRFKPTPGRLPRERLRLMTDEAMYLLAAMLPEHRRGYYADLSKATMETVERL